MFDIKLTVKSLDILDSDFDKSILEERSKEKGFTTEPSDRLLCKHFQHDPLSDFGIAYMLNLSRRDLVQVYSYNCNGGDALAECHCSERDLDKVLREVYLSGLRADALEDLAFEEWYTEKIRD
jgi:hypothetical protein